MKYLDDYKSAWTLDRLIDQSTRGKIIYSALTFFLITEVLEFVDIGVEAWFAGSRSLLRQGTAQIMQLVRTPSKALRSWLSCRSDCHVPVPQRTAVEFRKGRAFCSVLLGLAVIVPEVAVIVLGNLNATFTPDESLTGVRVDNIGEEGFVSKLGMDGLPSGFSGANPVLLEPSRGVFFAKQLLSVAVQREDLDDFKNQSAGRPYVSEKGTRNGAGCYTADYDVGPGTGIMEFHCAVQFAGLRIGCVVSHCDLRRLMVIRVDTFNTVSGDIYSVPMNGVNMTKLAQHVGRGKLNDVGGQALELTTNVDKGGNGFKAEATNDIRCEASGVLMSTAALLMSGLQISVGKGEYTLLEKMPEYGATCAKANVKFDYENRSQMLPPLFLVLMLLGMAALNFCMRIVLRLPWYSKSYRMACEALGGSCTSTPFRSSNESKKFQKWKTVNGESVAVLSPAPENGDNTITYEGHCGFKSPEVVPVRWRATAKRSLDATEEIEFVTPGLNQLVGQGLVWKLKPGHEPITVLLENGERQKTRVWRGSTMPSAPCENAWTESKEPQDYNEVETLGAASISDCKLTVEPGEHIVWRPVPPAINVAIKVAAGCNGENVQLVDEVVSGRLPPSLEIRWEAQGETEDNLNYYGDGSSPGANSEKSTMKVSRVKPTCFRGAFTVILTVIGVVVVLVLGAVIATFDLLGRGYTLGDLCTSRPQHP